jgi:hypothetical protein
MRKRLFAAALAAAGATLLAAPALPAAASGSPVGTVLTFTLAPGTKAVFSTTSGGSTGITCTSMTVSGTITVNPDSAGNEDGTVNSVTLSGCTSNITGVTKVNSITANNLPWDFTVTPAGAVTVTAGSGSAGPLQGTISLQSVLGLVNCAYTAPSLAGTITSGELSLTNQEFTLKSGSAICPKNGFFSATLVETGTAA